MIEVRNLSKRYGDKLAVDGLDFVVQPGIVTGFLGPNGAGKSTTMRLIAGLDEPSAGSVLVNGKGEMAQTATRLIVVGRGRLIADTTVEEFVARASGSSVTVRTPEAGRLRDLLLGPDVTITAAGGAAKVLILTTYDLDQFVYAGLRVGASGFLLKDAPRRSARRHPHRRRRRGGAGAQHDPAAHRPVCPAAP
jgi:ABC transporter